MTTEDNVTDAVDSTDAVVKNTRKPRSPNKPKTTEKLALLASRQVDRLNAKREEAKVTAVARVDERFDAKIKEFLDGLDDNVRPFVTGVGVVATVSDDVAEPTDSGASD